MNTRNLRAWAPVLISVIGWFVFIGYVYGDMQGQLQEQSRRIEIIETKVERLPSQQQLNAFQKTWDKARELKLDVVISDFTGEIRLLNQKLVSLEKKIDRLEK